MRLPDLSGKRVIILGTGREGRAAAEALAPVVASFAASDDRDGESAVAWRERW
jgi:UDP-N-acetylmuramoyl-L-alanine---L-glutamate ligase